jgi:hypothetical protein
VSSRFALDQSVVYGALERRPEPGLAMHAIIRRCDTVVWDREWHERCLRVVLREAAKGNIIALELLELIRQALVWAGKMLQVTGELPVLEDEGGIHAKDLWLVRLAVAAGATVVAEDAPLRKALCKRGIPCVTPREVVAGGSHQSRAT